MLNKYVLTGTIAAACSATMFAAQGQPQPQPTPQPAPAAQAAGQTGTTTVVGCVYRERDVPGRAPNVAERVGILEDYILMEMPGATASGAATAAGAGAGQASAGARDAARGAEGAQPSSGAQGAARDTERAQASAGRDAASTTGTTGTAAVQGRMFKLEHESDDRLQTLVGKRVEVMGRIDADEGDARNTAGATTSTTDKIIGRDAVDLAEFEVSSIKEVAGTCPTLTRN